MDGGLLCIESTSNQVNQDGGYTGQTPDQFAASVQEIAHEMKLKSDRLVLGGDHLGPHPWRKEKARDAMAKAVELVQSCVLAGYTKIHLDASMRCADDPSGPGGLDDEIVSQRAAAMCLAAEKAHKSLKRASTPPVYIIGTEVPVPGGEQAEGSAPDITTTKRLSHTIATTKKAFFELGLTEAWNRVLAVVTQPGVEFGDATVFPYLRSKAKKLSKFMESRGTMVCEAHSTDFQTPEALREMVQDHFAILKVGPWLTFAFREAVFALEHVEREWLGAKPHLALSELRAAMETAMLENPAYWADYYHGDAWSLQLARKYSYSDRSRYYWGVPAVTSSLQRLMENLARYPAPVSLLSQFLPNQAALIRSGHLQNRPEDIVRSKIMEVTSIYSEACGLRERESFQGRSEGRRK